MLELRNVTKAFNLTGNKEDLRIALDHVNLQIESGEFVTIIGGNGSGHRQVWPFKKSICSVIQSHQRFPPFRRQTL